MPPPTTNGLFVDGKKKPIPYEIFLVVVEALISDAASDETTQTFLLRHCLPNATHMVLVPCTNTYEASDTVTDEHDLSPVQSRYRKIRLTAQLDRKTRGMTFRTFRRMHMSYSGWRCGSYPDALVLPEIDRFDPSDILSWSTGPYENILARPSPETYAMIRHMKHIILSTPFPLLNLYRLEVCPTESLLNIPNLEDIKLAIKSDFTTPYHSGLRSPDNRQSYNIELQMVQYHNPNLGRTWQKFKERGIKLFGVLASGEVVIEVIPKETLYMRFIAPDCTCCKRET